MRAVWECVIVCVCMYVGVVVVAEPPYTVPLNSTPESSLSFFMYYFLRSWPWVVDFCLFAMFWSIFVFHFLGLVFVSLSLSRRK